MSTVTFGVSQPNAQRSKDRFLANAVATGSPAALLVMLFDRLVLDLARAEEAQRAGSRAEAGTYLTHAQDIVGELMSSLDLDAWDGAPALFRLYSFLLAELVRANVSGDSTRTAACRRVVEPLRDTWREAAGQVGGSTAVSDRVG